MESQAIFQAKTQIKILLLNCPPAEARQEAGRDERREEGQKEGKLTHRRL